MGRLIEGLVLIPVNPDSQHTLYIVLSFLIAPMNADL
jgi:hypothetical protein